MNDLQTQIFELRDQLRHLNHVIEAMPKQIIAALVSNGITNEASSINRLQRETLEYSFAHKDIIDEDNAHVCQGDQQIPCEWQLGRLSAQLTYAYERIAALEKQLLSRHLSNR
ncbi:hypothetical protein Syn7502_00038 [Synechococcus sp. PCC 7502]|uniref:hypothetical protein n=1 Tax=Synechococcus sp. PCC 7502 TaxID=1173263 RepID=UPI00029FD9CE|nr:hypothetical protein [Synechococcus sp. PCC 7502]AFY72213.1 hypothetical protein Syn7502_00038 [Synechococcus sp. PCC 7502]